MIVFHRKLLDPGLPSSSRQSMFLNLLYKSLKADIVLRRVKAFVKRLLQVSCTASPAFTCGVLFLVSELMKAKPGLRLMLQQEEVSSLACSQSAFCAFYCCFHEMYLSRMKMKRRFTTLKRIPMMMMMQSKGMWTRMKK